jgi:hypothetical protein
MSGQAVINFTRGVPAEESFPIDLIQAAAESAIGKYGKTILQYGKSTGFAPLLEIWSLPKRQVMIGRSPCFAAIMPMWSVFLWKRMVSTWKPSNIN